MSKIVKQRKTDEELANASNRIIDLLKGYNWAERYKVIKSLYSSLLDLIQIDMRGIIMESDNGTSIEF